MNGSVIKCEVCHKTFPDINSLRKHGVTHSNERPFKCEICGKSFKTKVSLKQHIAVHENVSFECSVCKKTIRQRNNLYKHMKNVHDLVGNQLDTAMEKSINKKASEVEIIWVENPQPQLHNNLSILRMLAMDSEGPLSKIAKNENCSQPIKRVGLNDSQPFSTLLDAIKLEEYENQLVQEASESTLLEDQNLFPAAEVSTSKSVMGNHESQIPQQEFSEASQKFQATHFQNPQPSNFDEDSRQISHQIMRVAVNSTKDRQDCFRQLLFATVFAFESSPTCTNVEEFFRMMGERYAKK
ncbi:hypothetical protein CRE_14557 [Caenorhabditis remanei]|uniref:C2H2-type domain-containing protein n=1 Tax=Caenorhabditis remanei TaxID=31234 RepID=E3M9I3_CAERE|nr:hypothetical protein CRE_14557 [Caenorhabditis remanei]